MRQWVLWTEAEKSYLRKHASGMTVLELSKAMSDISPIVRNPESVRLKCKQLGLQPVINAKHKWTAKEKASLKNSYGRMKTKAIADELGIPRKAVYAMVNALGLRHGNMERVTPWVDSMLEEYEAGKSLYSESVMHWEAGKTVETRQQAKGSLAGKMAVFCRQTGG